MGGAKYPLNARCHFIYQTLKHNMLQLVYVAYIIDCLKNAR